MKIIKDSGVFLLSFLVISLLSNCSFLNIFSPSPYQLVYNDAGNKVLRDNKAKREGFGSAINSHIERELAKDHVPGARDHDWRKFWIDNFKVINKGSENPQWYINYIIVSRRNAGLPEL